ncbi:MAG TPA: hypothetical protein VE029_01030 [Rhizobacter sp.]|nr:hypothetical protein [Rhizobacter sp.]
MRMFMVLPLVLTLAAPAAQALSLDAKAIARFDISYAKCETQYPEMKGHRDEAYLSLWRVQADEKNRAQLDKLRKGTTYQAEKARILKSPKEAAAAASRPLSGQCQALWSETQKVAKTKQ